MIEPTEQEIEAAREKAAGAKTFQAEVELDEEKVYAIFKKPSRAEFHRYLDAVGAKDAKMAAIARAQETFVLSATLWPAASELKKLFEEHYTLGTKLAEEVFKVAAGETKAATKGL